MNLRVTCALIVNGDKLLCAQRSATMRLPLQWEFPGGKIEPGESPEACIIREIAEELSLEIEVLLQGPAVLHPMEDGRILELIPLVCQVLGGALRLREHAQVRWCTVAQMADLDWAKADLGIIAWWNAQGQQILRALNVDPA